MHLSSIVRNAMLNTLEATFGTAPVLRIRTGPRPAAITDSSTGTIVVSIPLPSDWLGDAIAGQKMKQGDWSAAATAASTSANPVGHYEIVSTDGTVVMERGVILATADANASTADMQLQNLIIAVGQTVTITSKVYTAGGTS